MNPKYKGPLDVIIEATKHQMELLGPGRKHWFAGGDRSMATAVNLLNEGGIIAIPTDTIYGLAASVDNDKAIKRLYEIKKRDEQKPLAICVSGVNDIRQWGITDNLPPRLIELLLPGPYTIILERTKELNPALNPGINNVGIRVPNDKFIRSVTHLAGPLALTSANESNMPSSVHPQEFSNLWYKLDGIFYKASNMGDVNPSQRIGSTIIDLTQPGYYKILRKGVKLQSCIRLLHLFNLKPNNDE